MTTSGKRFINVLNNRKTLQTQQTAESEEISTGESTPKSTQTTEPEQKTISIPSSIAKAKANQTVSTQTPSSVSKIASTQPTTSTATMTSATQSQIEQNKKGYADKYSNISDEHKYTTDGGMYQALEKITNNALTPLHNAASFANETMLLGRSLFTTAGTQNVETVRNKGEDLLQSTLSSAQDTLEKNKERGADIRKEFNTIYTDGSKDYSNIDLWKPAGIPTTFTNGWLSTSGDTLYVTNGKSTISKPVVKSLDYNSILANAYRSVTSNYYANGTVLTVDQIKQAYPTYQHISDDTIQQFINECIYDVQNGLHTDINDFANYFGSMSMSENYTNQKDAILKVVTDDDVLNNSIGQFIVGNQEMAGRTSEEIQEFVNAAMTIQEFADQVNEAGYNETGISSYTIARMFENDVPEVKAALETFDKFDIKMNEVVAIENQYNQTIKQDEELTNKIINATPTEYKKLVDEYANQYLTDFNKEFMNSFNKERLQSDRTTALGDFFYGNSYESNGKYYNYKGEEIPQDDVTKGVVNKYIESWENLGNQITELNYDTELAKISVSAETDDRIERIVDVVSDSVNTVFAAGMVGKGGMMFQFKSELPFVGHLYEGAFDFVLDNLGDFAGVMGDMIGFTDGWSEESKQKYENAVAGLGLMAIGQVKQKLSKKLNTEIDNSALIKSVKAWAKAYVGGMRYIDKTKTEQLIKDRWDLDNEGKPTEESKTPSLENKVSERPTLEDKTSIKPEETKDTGKTETTETTEPKKETTKEKSTTKNQIRLQFTKYMLDKAKQEFNKTFENELSKNQGERSIIDDLYQLALDTYNSKPVKGEVVETAPESARDVSEERTPETTQRTTDERETVQTEEPSKTTADTTKQSDVSQPTEEGFVTSEAAPVEGTEAGTPTETPEGTATTSETETPTERKSKADTIKQILDVANTIWETGKKITKKIQSLREKNTEKQIREREIELQTNRETFQEHLTNEEIDVMENNPYTDLLIDLVNNLTTEIKEGGKTKKVTKDRSASQDEIQRYVLSEGIQRIQEYIDYLISKKSQIGKLYDKLSTDRTIDTSTFAESDGVKEILSDTNLEIDKREDEDGIIRYHVTTKDGSDMKSNEVAIAKYLETMLNENIGDRNISEKDAHAIRTKMTADGDWNKSGDFPSAIKKQLTYAWNKFLEEQGGSELLRRIDASENKLFENLDIFKDLLDKNNDVRDNAKNKILKRTNEEIAMMESIIPGIKDLIALAKASPKIVNELVAQRTKTKGTRERIAGPVRYAFVMLPSTIGLMSGGTGGAIIGTFAGAFVFKWSNMIGNYLANKIRGKAPYLETFNKMIDELNTDGRLTGEAKKKMLETLQEIENRTKGKTEAETQKIWQDALDILIKRQADLLEKRRQENERRTQAKNERSKQERKNKTKKSGTPALPESAEGGVEAPDTFRTRDEIVEGLGAKETYKDKEKTQKPYDKIITEASIGITEEGKSEGAEEIANKLGELQNSLALALIDHAQNNLMEKGEAPTEENVAKELGTDTTKEDTVMDFLDNIEKTGDQTPQTGKINFKGVSYQILKKFLDKNGNVKPEYKEYETEILQAIAQYESDTGAIELGEIGLPKTQGAQDAKRQRKLATVEDMSDKRDTLREQFVEEYHLEGWSDEDVYNKMMDIKNGNFKSVKRGNNSDNDAALKLLKSKQHPITSWTSKLENILELPTSEGKVNMLYTKWKNTKNLQKKQEIRDAYQSEKEKLDKLKEDKARLTEIKKQQKSEKTTIKEKKSLEKEKQSIIDEAELMIGVDSMIAKESSEQEKGADESINEEPRELSREEMMERDDTNRIKELKENIAEREKAKKEANGNVAKWDPFDEENLQQAKEELAYREKLRAEREERKRNEAKQQVSSSESEPETTQETKTGQLTAEEKKQFKKIDSEITSSLFEKGGTDPRATMTDREKIDFTNSTKQYPEFYHASDTEIKKNGFDLSKTKDDPNGLGLSVSVSKDNAYTDKPHQYTISGKNTFIAKEETTLSEEKINQLCEKLGIEPNPMWQYVPLAELTSIIRGEVEAIGGKSDSKTILDAFQSVTQYDGAETSHGYVILWNQNKINANATKTEISKPETKVEPEKKTTGWKGKENLKNFDEKFADEGNLTEEDEYGEVVGKTKEQKVREYVQTSFKKVDRGATSYAEGIYDIDFAKARELRNGHIDTKDATLIYRMTPKDINGKSENAKATFNGNKVSIAIGTRKGQAPNHEYGHYMDFKLGKELGIDNGTPLSDTLEAMGDNLPTDTGDTKTNLLNRFANLFSKIKQEAAKGDDYIEDPAEIFARLSEGFMIRGEGKEKTTTSAGEAFSDGIYEELTDILGDMDEARVKGELFDGTLEEGEIQETYDYRHTDASMGVSDKTRSKIERFAKIYGIDGKNTLELVMRLDHKLPKYRNGNLTRLQQEIYDTIKYEYVKEVLDYTGDKVLNLGKPDSDNKNSKTKGTFLPLREGSVKARPHIGGVAYDKLLQEGYIVNKNKFYKKD